MEKIAFHFSLVLLIFTVKSYKIKYDPDKIKEIIKKNNFPENYNFIEELKPPVHIKDETYSQSGWAFAITTALSYRFFKKGINVDLSPQYLIKCYEKGWYEDFYYLIEAQFYLSKNGTVTESCLPFNFTGFEINKKCPKKCNNGKKFKKYYSKNAYTTMFEYNDKEKYYDVVKLIMDQLINYGPVASSIMSNTDFEYLTRKKNCKNKIYKYSKNSADTYYYGVVIVGYGYENSTYYWIIQNSWGKQFCDNGFAKIEFGTIEIENVALSEPYIPDNSTKKNKISVKMNINEKCQLVYKTENGNDEISFEIIFENEDLNSKFYYQCTKLSSSNEKEGICNYDFSSYQNNIKGYYKYKDHQSLHTNNIYNLDFSSMPNNQFLYNGQYEFDPFYEKKFYISEEGNTILLNINFGIYEEDKKFFSKIYPNNNTKIALSECDILPFVHYNYLYCNIKQNETKYFKGKNKNLPLIYDTFCGIKEETFTKIYILDKTKYPSFRIHSILLPNGTYIKENTKFTLIANIEGSISKFKGKDNIFFTFINIENKNENSTEKLECKIPRPLKIQDNFEINCEIFLWEKIKFKNIYLLHYFYPYKYINPFEIIIKNDIKAMKYEDYKKMKSNNKSTNYSSENPIDFKKNNILKTIFPYTLIIPIIIITIINKLLK